MSDALETVVRRLMSKNSISRRSLLRSGAAGAGAVVMGGLAGCSGGPGDSSSGNLATVESVPAESQVLINMDFAGMIEDQNLRDVGNAFIGGLAEAEGYNGPTDIDSAFAAAEDEAGITPSDVSSMLVFGKVEQDSEYGGALMNSSISEEDLTAAASENGAEYEESTYGGKTVYTTTAMITPTGEDVGIDSGALGVLGDGQYVLGTQAVVEDVIDVVNGDADPVSGEVLTNYENTTEGYLRMAAQLPEDFGQESGMSVASSVQYLSGSFYSQESELGLDITMHTESSDAATQLQGLFQAQLDQMGQDADEQLAQFLEGVTIETDDANVTISVVQSVSLLEDYARIIATLFASDMGTAPSDRAPATSLGFD